MSSESDSKNNLSSPEKTPSSTTLVTRLGALSDDHDAAALPGSPRQASRATVKSDTPRSRARADVLRQYTFTMTEQNIRYLVEVQSRIQKNDSAFMTFDGSSSSDYHVPPEVMQNFAQLLCTKENQQGNTVITTLNFSNMHYGSVFASHIAEVLKFNFTIKVMILDGNNLRDVGVIQLARALSTNRIIEELSLNDNQITQASTDQLFSALINTTLKKLSLSTDTSDKNNKNAITLGKCATLKLLLQSNSVLEELNLDGIDFIDDGVSSIADGLTKNLKLRILSLNNSRLGQKGLKSLVTCLPHNRTLERLYLRNNGLQTCANELLSLLNSALQVIDLSHNQLGIPGIRSIATQLQSNTSLLELFLDSVKLSAEALPTLMTALKSNRNLFHLSLRQNALQDNSAQCIADFLQTDHQTLRNLNLSNNSITNQGITQIVRALNNNIYLNTLDIRNNQHDQSVSQALMLMAQNNIALVDLYFTNVSSEIEQELASQLAYNKCLQFSLYYDTYLALYHDLSAQQDHTNFKDNPTFRSKAQSFAAQAKILIAFLDSEVGNRNVNKRAIVLTIIHEHLCFIEAKLNPQPIASSSSTTMHIGNTESLSQKLNCLTDILSTHSISTIMQPGNTTINIDSSPRDKISQSITITSAKATPHEHSVRDNIDAETGSVLTKLIERICAQNQPKAGTLLNAIIREMMEFLSDDRYKSAWQVQPPAPPTTTFQSFFGSKSPKKITQTNPLRYDIQVRWNIQIAEDDIQILMTFINIINVDDYSKVLENHKAILRKEYTEEILQVLSGANSEIPLWQSFLELKNAIIKGISLIEVSYRSPQTNTTQPF